jgi:hypothetical protein
MTVPPVTGSPIYGVDRIKAPALNRATVLFDRLIGLRHLAAEQVAEAHVSETLPQFSPRPAGQLQQFADLLWRQRLGQIFERDRILHHLVEALDLVELQHRRAPRSVGGGGDNENDMNDPDILLAACAPGWKGAL